MCAKRPKSLVFLKKGKQIFTFPPNFITNDTILKTVVAKLLNLQKKRFSLKHECTKHDKSHILNNKQIPITKNNF